LVYIIIVGFNLKFWFWLLLSKGTGDALLRTKDWLKKGSLSRAVRWYSGLKLRVYCGNCCGFALKEP
jgi:hypothetical protein